MRIRGGPATVTGLAFRLSWKPGRSHRHPSYPGRGPRRRSSPMPLFLSTADTDLLAARAAQRLLPDDFGALRIANPVGIPAADVAGLLAGLAAGADFVLVRLLGGRGAWQDGLDALRAACAERRLPLVALGGESYPRRRADRPVHRGVRRGDRGCRLSRRGRAGQHQRRCCASCPTRCCSPATASTHPWPRRCTGCTPGPPRRDRPTRPERLATSGGRRPTPG